MNLPFISMAPSLPAVLGVATIAAMLAGAGGYALGHHTAAAIGDADLAELKREHAAALVVASEDARKQERALTAMATQLAARLDAERSTHAQEINQLKGTIARVTAQYRPAPDAPLQPLPHCVFTNGFVGVWNAAIGASSGASVPAAGGAVATADQADAGETLDSGIEQTDILGNIADFGLRCRDIESQLNSLIDWHIKREAP